MTTKIARILLVGMVVSLLSLQATIGQCWSLNPFSSSDKNSSKKTVKTVKKEPSTLDKIGSALGFKKTETKKTVYTTAVPKTPAIQQPKKESNSWFSSWFSSNEPKKKKTVNEWMKQERLDP